jgi:hypothetical protein
LYLPILFSSSFHRSLHRAQYQLSCPGRVLVIIASQTFEVLKALLLLAIAIISLLPLHCSPPHITNNPFDNGHVHLTSFIALLNAL